MLLNLLGFFTRQQTLACSISETASDGGLVTMNLDFHYAGNSVDTADFKMSVDYSSSSEAQQKLAETENTLRETANTVINGSNGGASVDANVYAEGSRVIIDTHFSRDAFARTALATGITQTKSIDETKSSVESKLPGIICNIR
jgi:hypothetical protein